MTVVSNTTPLIGLGRIGRLNLLPEIFGQIIIPQAVRDEIFTTGHIEDPIIQTFQAVSWIVVQTVADRLAVDVLLDELDLGEAETIVLARELNATWVLMDEKKGRRKLAELGLSKIGTIGILINARQTGKIPSLANELILLRQHGFSLSQFVLDAALRQVGELR
jgi:hypothetical protein